MAEQKTHWKKNLDTQFLGAYSFPEKTDAILTIKEIKLDEVSGAGNKKSKCNLLFFNELEKPMVLNRTNSKMIQKLYGTPYIEEWIGKKIQLYVTMVKAVEEERDCLRIRDFKPEAQKIDNTAALATLKTSKRFSELQVAYNSLSKELKADKEVLAEKERLKISFQK